MECSYCSDDARGIDEDGEATCGNEDTCTVVCSALPAVVEVSDDYGDDEDEETLQ